MGDLMENKICFYAICKDEIQFVDKWIENMSEADYIVVLDTGSTDGTYEKLKSDERITRVEQTIINPWRFDVARNMSMELIPEDTTICLCTDFDELFEPGWAKIIKSVWNENIWRGKYRYIWSHTSTGNEGVAFTYDKMHSLNPRYEWHFAVHEVLGLKGEDLYQTGALENDENTPHIIDFGDAITLHHYPDNTKDRTNYLDLLRLRAEENPDDVYSVYLLAREYGVRRDWNTALELFEKCLSLPNINTFPLVKYIVIGYMGNCYEMIDKNMEAILCYHMQIKEDRTHREPYMRLGGIYSRMELYQMSVAVVEEGLKNSTRHYDWTEQSDAWNEMPYDILSVSYLRLNNKDKALENVIKALKYAPNSERIRNNYLSILDLH